MRKRLPKLQDILQVYAVIAAMLAGWTITAFLWKLSAWLLLLHPGEIFTIFSYAMAANFVESLLVLSILLAASVLLPADFLYEDFVVRGTILAIGLIGALMLFVRSEMQFGIESGLGLFLAPFAVLSLMVFLLARLSKRSPLRAAALWLSDRLVVFLFVLVPLFAVGTAYVIFRNVV